MKISKIQKVRMREQKIQLILLKGKLCDIKCDPRNLNYKFINNYVSCEIQQIIKTLMKIDIFIKCDYNVQAYDENEIAEYIVRINNNLSHINNYLM